MRITAPLSLLALLAPVSASHAQALPTTQPSFITINREEVKLGRGADHARWEAGWPAALEKAKSPDTYIALASMTGPGEVWYVSPFASHAALAASAKRDAANAVLSAELERLAKGDAEFLTAWRSIQAVARPDLSMGAFPDLATHRFWEISTWRVRMGHEDQFDAAAKAYIAAAKRSGRPVNFRTYQVIAGMPAPTYFIFSSVAGYDEFDKMMADGNAVMAGATAEETSALQKFSIEGGLNVETNRFSLDPGQSYVNKETRDRDPKFWYPKKPTP